MKHERGYYAGYSADNPIGYKTSGEKAYRMYELRTDWSDAINKAIQDGNHITNYNGSQTYSYEDLDKTGMERSVCRSTIRKKQRMELSLSILVDL